MNVPFSALDKQHTGLLPEIFTSLEATFQTAHFILGHPVVEFEKNLLIIIRSHSLSALTRVPMHSFFHYEL